MNLPNMKYSPSKYYSDVLKIRGINFTDNIRDGDLTDSGNVSLRRYPYLTTRNARKQIDDIFGVSYLFSRDKLIYVKNGKLFIDRDEVCDLVEEPKQMCVVGNYLIVLPNKLLFDLTEYGEEGAVPAPQELEPSIKITDELGDIIFDRDDNAGEYTITATASDASIAKLVKVGQSIVFSGLTGYGVKNNNGIPFRVIGINSNYSVNIDKASGQKMTAGIARGLAVTVKRAFPELSFVCEYENRLVGCSNKDHKIYVSALGDPATFFDYADNTTASAYEVEVSSDGEFTGISKLGSSVIVFKEKYIYKLLGSHPAEYYLYSYEVDGLKKGCHKSCTVINETLFYMGLHGVYAYGGGIPSLASDFGEREFGNAVGGTDGETYYLSCTDELDEDETPYLLTYNTHEGMWVLESHTRVLDFTRIGDKLYLLDEYGRVYIENTSTLEPGIEWYAQFCPLYETIDGKKGYTKLIIRADIPADAYLIINIRLDGKQWRTVSRSHGNSDGLQIIRLPVGRCDKFELKLWGKGNVTILGIHREFNVWSAR